jgi:hypothetical protein
MINGSALHDNSTASPASAEILKRVQQAWGFVHNGRILNVRVLRPSAFPTTPNISQRRPTTLS